jgi:molecular chaperone DnaJ
MKQDYYNALGISKNASEKEIKKAFRSMAMKYHPDKNNSPDAEKKFKEVNEAYNVLSSPDKKSNYDKFGHADPGSMNGHGFGGFEDIFGGFGGFGDMFGRKSSRRVNKKGSDIRYTVNVSLENIFKGGSVSFNIPRNVSCGPCRGTGADGKAILSSCGACGGKGVVTQSTGFMVVNSQCRSCNGEGSFIKNKCKKCHGNKAVPKNEKLKITLPRGIEGGVTMRLSGKGNESLKGGRSGDLYLTISEKKHDLYTRMSGGNISHELKIDYATACLGGTRIVNTLHGKCEIKIPKGTQQGDTIRIRGKGCYIMNSSSVGSQYNNIVVDIPKDISDEEVELLEQIKKIRKSS